MLSITPVLRALEGSEGQPRRLSLLWPVVNALQGVFAVFWCVFCISSAFLVSLFSRELPLAMARRMWAPPLIGMTGCRFEVEPLPEGVDWSQPHIFVMNHQSAADIPCAFAALPANIRFVAKHTLKYVPFIGWYMWRTGMIFVNRSNRTQAISSLAAAGQRIRAGASILAYPEGTRSPDGRILPFKKGPFVLALEAKVPIIPVAIDGTAEVLPRGGLKLRPATVRMKIGAPIETAHLVAEDREDLLRQTRDAIIRLHREIGGPGGGEGAIAPPGVEGRTTPEA